MADPSPLAPVVAFVAGTEGVWRLDGILAHKGETLAPAARLAVIEGDEAAGVSARWTLRGVVGPPVYTNETEAAALAAAEEPLGRAAARSAVLIAIRKTPAWWAMPHAERRAVLEERSHHVAIGIEYLPAIARRLHHARELSEPFDFLAWFEYVPADQPVFDELLSRLRATEEWSFVEREVEVRVTR